MEQLLIVEDDIELSKTEQKLLRLLVENRGRTMTRGDLVDRIWTDGAEYVDENALSVTIKRLRDKLGAQKYITNSVQKQEGVGIGLYLARQIISGEGGYIKVASVPGKGSTFSIFLPKSNNSIKIVRFHFPLERMWKESYAIICMYQRMISLHTYRFFHGGTHLWRFYRQKT